MAINEWLEFYNNSRTLAMGGASVAITSDDTSLYRNPANLGSVRDVYGTLLDPEIEGTGNLTASSIKISDVMNTLGSKNDVYYRAKQQLSPVLVRRNIGFGLIYKNEISAEIHSATPTVMDTAYRSDIGAVLGTDVRLFDGRIKIGVSGRAFNRIEVMNSSLSTSGPTDLATIGAEGTAYALDGGVLIQAPWTYIPTLGVVAHDIGDTVFKSSGLRVHTAATPATVKQSLDAAIAIFPIHSNLLRSVWTLEYSDVTNSRNDTDNSKRIHLGIEFNARDMFFFRMGYNQRYLTAGIEVASEYIVWQLTTYGEDVGTAAAPQEDRRISTKLAIRF
ncbi:MAG: hypothetical protein ACXVBD_08695 [Pseudobdellovibrio sp.]